MASTFNLEIDCKAQYIVIKVDHQNFYNQVIKTCIAAYNDFIDAKSFFCVDKKWDLQLSINVQ